MAFLLTRADFVETEKIAEKSYIISVRCPVDVEVYDTDDTLIAKITNNIIDDSVTNTNVFCKVEGDEKYIFVESDKEIYVRIIGTDSGVMEYGVQKLKAPDEITTDDDFTTYKTVSLEKGKEFYSDITEKKGTADISLYVVDSKTKQPIKTVELDGTEVPISLENTYKITFDANGGTTSDTTLTTDTNGKIAKLPTATRTGYTFDGWFTATENGEKITADTVFTEDTTVYAHWTKNTESSDTPIIDQLPDDPDTSDETDTFDKTESSDTESGNDDSTVSSTPSEPASSGVSSSISADPSSNSADMDSISSNSDETDYNRNPSTGAAVVMLPVIFAAGALVVIVNKKNRK